MTSNIVVGDWGSTNLRLWRLRDGTAAERFDGPGIVGLEQKPSEVLRECLSRWDEADPPGLVILSGMAGARGGLREVPYASCRLSRLQWQRSALDFEIDGLKLRIAAGCSLAGGTTGDVMRGEETQIFGAMSAQSELRTGRQSFILPGTHSKWAFTENGDITTFRTFLTGELYSLLLKSSLIVDLDDSGAEFDEAGFADGLAEADRGPGILGALFGVRSAQVLQGRPKVWAISYLSGLLIGTEIREGLEHGLLKERTFIIGAERLSALYLTALRRRSIECQVLDGEACALAGLRMLDVDD